jgi:hypothetical protein
MKWTELQWAELSREYDRIGFRPGDRWPAPPEHLQPVDLLALFRRIPNGAGREGYVAELAKLAK